VLKIRLRRMGSKKDPFYRVVVSESKITPSGRFVEVVGTYDPRTEPATVRMDVEKTEDWIRKGAHPSATVKSLLLKAKSAQA